MSHKRTAHAFTVCAVLFAGCSGNSPSAPTPPSTAPTPAPVITIQGTITDTVFGNTIGTFSRTVPSLPALIEVSTAGYLTRTARITSPAPVVDLIRDAPPFNLQFYREMARGTSGGATPRALFTLAASPRMYLQLTANMTPALVAILRASAEQAITDFSGGALRLAAWETGAANRPDENGWIMVEMVNEDPQTSGCGRARVGALAGRIWMNVEPRCLTISGAIGPHSYLMHEIGHALGFSHHTGTGGHLMTNPVSAASASVMERHFGAIAYKRPFGNLDIDVDPLVPFTAASLLSPRSLIVECSAMGRPHFRSGVIGSQQPAHRGT